MADYLNLLSSAESIELQIQEKFSQMEALEAEKHYWEVQLQDAETDLLRAQARQYQRMEEYYGDKVIETEDIIATRDAHRIIQTNTAVEVQLRNEIKLRWAVVNRYAHTYEVLKRLLVSGAKLLKPTPSNQPTSKPKGQEEGQSLFRFKKSK